ncbi:hypothetical protein D6833_12725, partial [Candidatus Parcubacteria bacterium]
MGINNKMVMNMLRISNFKGFRGDHSMDTAKVHLVTGGNGSGKTTLLEAIGLLSAAAHGDLGDDAITRRGVRFSSPAASKARDHEPVYLAWEDGGCTYAVDLDGDRTWGYVCETVESDQVALELQREGTPQDGLAAIHAAKMPQEEPAAKLIHSLGTYT